MKKKLSLSVVMLTLNEEYHIGDAIDNVSDFAERVYILDSLSHDRTVDIAVEKGAIVMQRPFTNFGDQWNYALQNFPIDTTWTLKLDPDERLTDDLKKQLSEVMLAADSVAGYEFPRRLWFMGKPLHVYANVLRLWRTGKCEFSDVLVNEHPIIDGSVEFLSGVMEHFDSRDLHHWYEKQNKYSSMEALTVHRRAALAAAPRLLGSNLERRVWLKKHFSKLPFRFTLLFIYNFIFKGAWKSGRSGFVWSHLRSEIMRNRELKVEEMATTGREIYIPRSQGGNYDERILSTELQKSIMQAD